MAEKHAHAPSSVPTGVGSALGGLFQAIAAVINTQQQIKWEGEALRYQQDFEREQGTVRFGRELQIEAVRALRQRELAELDARLGQESALIDIRNRKLFDTYPVEEGPGHLRESLRLLSSDLASLPLVVLLPQFRGTEERQWAGLRDAVAGELRQELASDRQIILADNVRPLSWPHANLYWNDLYGIPTLVVQVTSYRDTLDVSLGGCHLRPQATAQGEALRSVYRYQSPRDDYWTGEVLAELNAAASSGNRLAEPETDADRARLDIEVAARAVTAAVAAAVDVYYLGIRARYRQRFDHAVAMLGPGALPDWPADLSVPIKQVADPAFHLLHIASRQLDRGLFQEALFTVRQSLATLIYPDCALIKGPFPTLNKSAEAVAAGDDGYRQQLRSVLIKARQRLRENPDHDQDNAMGQDLDEIWRVLGE